MDPIGGKYTGDVPSTWIAPRPNLRSTQVRHAGSKASIPAAEAFAYVPCNGCDPQDTHKRPALGKICAERILEQEAFFEWTLPLLPLTGAHLATCMCSAHAPTQDSARAEHHHRARDLYDKLWINPFTRNFMISLALHLNRDYQMFGNYPEVYTERVNSCFGGKENRW